MSIQLERLKTNVKVIIERQKKLDKMWKDMDKALKEHGYTANRKTGKLSKTVNPDVPPPSPKKKKDD